MSDKKEADVKNREHYLSLGTILIWFCHNLIGF